MKRSKVKLGFGLACCLALVFMLTGYGVVAGADRESSGSCGAEWQDIPTIAFGTPSSVKLMPVSGSEPAYEPNKWNDCTNP